MIDANQRWDVQEAIDRVTALKEFKPLWVRILYLGYTNFQPSKIKSHHNEFIDRRTNKR